MPAVPKFVGKVNKRVFNPREIRKGKRPVLVTKGRSSGRDYLTPLDAHRVDDDFLFIVMYGSDCDWVQNVLAAGSASLRIAGSEIALDRPRLVGIDEARAAFETLGVDTSKLWTKAEYLRMSVS